MKDTRHVTIAKSMTVSVKQITMKLAKDRFESFVEF